MSNATKKQIQKTESQIQKKETGQDKLLIIARDTYAINEVKAALNALLNATNEERAVKYAELCRAIPQIKKEVFYAVYSSTLQKEISLYRQDRASDCAGEKIAYNKSCDLHTFCSIARLIGSGNCADLKQICSMLPQKKIGGSVNHNRRIQELIKMLIAIHHGA